LFSPSNVRRLQQRQKQQRKGTTVTTATTSTTPRGTPQLGSSRDALLCGTGISGHATEAPYGGRVSGLLSSVVNQTLLPAVSTVYSNISTSASVADVAASKIGETLVGHSEQDFEEAVQAKMRLLSELSSVRAELGADEATRRRLEDDVTKLQRERDEAIKARTIFEEALQTTQKEEDRLRAAVDATVTELNEARSTSLDATTAANKLAAQNELLKAQTEQLRGHFGVRERTMVEQLTAAQSQLEERMRSIQALREEIARYDEQLRLRDAEVESTSRDLGGAKAAVQGLEEQLRHKEEALASASLSAEDMRAQIAVLEQSIADTARSAEESTSERETRHKTEIQGMREEMDRMTAESKAKLSKLEADLKEAASAKSSLEEDVARITEELEKSKEEAESYRSKLDARMSEIEELKANITGGVEAMQLQADEAAKAWQEKEIELKAEIEEQRMVSARAETEFNERAAAFESDLRDAASAKSSLEDEVRRLTDDFTESQDSLADCQKQIKQHESAMTELQNEMSAKIEALKIQAEEAARTSLSSKEEEMTKEIKRQQELVDEAQAVSQAKEEYYESAMRKLQTRLDAKKEIVNKLNAKHAESTAKFENDIADLKEQIAKKQVQLDESENERNDKSTVLRVELEAMQQSKADMERELEVISAKCQSLQEASDEMDQKWDRLRSERDMLEIEKQSLWSKLKMEADAYAKAKDEHQHELNTAKEETARIRKSFEEKVDALISEVERVESFMTSEHSKLEARNDELSESLATRDDEIATLRKRLVNSERLSTEEEGEILRLGDELNALRNELTRAEHKVQECETRATEALAAVKDREQALCVSLLRQTKDKQVFDDTLSQRDARIATIESELSVAQAKVESIEEDKEQAAESAESYISHLIEAAETSDMRASDTKTLLDRREQVLEAAKNSLMNACEKLELAYPEGDTDESLVASIAIIADKATYAITQSASMKDDVVEVEERLHQLRDALNMAAESLQQCEKSKEEWESKATLAEEQVAALKAQINTLESDITVSTEANEALSHNMEGLRSSLEEIAASRDSLTETLSNELGEKKDLATRVRLLEEQLSKKSEEYERLEARSEELKVKCAGAESMGENLASKTVAFDELQAKTASLEDKITELQQRNESTDFARQVAETRLSKTQAVASKLETEKTELESHLATKSSELEEVSRELDAKAIEIKAATDESRHIEMSRDAATRDLECLRSFIDGEGDASSIKGELSASALYIYESVETLMQKQKVAATEKFASTPRSNNSKRRAPAGTPSQMLSPLISPSVTAGIVSKHADIIGELQKMKEAINRAAASPSCKTDVRSSLEQSVETEEEPTRDEVLSTLESRIETLVDDLTSAQDALDEKENLLKEVAVAVDDIEDERNEMQHKLDTVQNYAQRMEETLTRELQWRQNAEAEIKALRRKANLASAEKQKKADLIKWTVAQEVAQQLEQTREKLFMLKSHLREGGQPRVGVSPIGSHSHPPFPSAAGASSPNTSAQSAFWNVSDDEGVDA